ncbi:hypothetical protein Btru_050860 [Bulinus truncatus]|nr:hypothetical protein Btru_050860 [Bulinus truncatus]
MMTVETDQCFEVVREVRTTKRPCFDLSVDSPLCPAMSTVGLTADVQVIEQNAFHASKERLVSLKSSWNSNGTICPSCAAFYDIQAAGSLDQACRKIEAFCFCSKQSSCSSNCSILDSCASPKLAIRETVKPLEGVCDGKCDSYLREVTSQDTTDQTCQKVDDLDTCMSLRCDYAEAYTPILTSAHQICDGCGYLSVSILLLLVGNFTNKETIFRVKRTIVFIFVLPRFPPSPHHHV